MGHLRTAIALIFGFTFLQTHGERVVERVTGRTGKPAKSNKYDAVYFAIAILIGIPPIYMFPNAHYLVLATFMIAGALVGRLVAQGLLSPRA
ncbi:MAG: hypothetical protein H8E66_29065 [Planctomycetes bacterium]|nr:hypothetical protein [Planctomycetota bacterium]